MRLSTLIASSDGLALNGNDTDIAGITEDSREVGPGFLFAAIPGTEKNGATFIGDAVKRGAAAILRQAGDPAYETHLPVITTSNIRKSLSAIAAHFYPGQPETMVAVTGTSGKTSTAQFTREIWQSMGLRAGSMGSLGLTLPDSEEYSSINTPGPVVLHRRLHQATEQGVTHLVMEASSHGLAMHRMDGVRLRAAGFTNLSHDHLDYHRDMASYLNAKLRLFAELLPPGATAALNTDIPHYDAIAAASHARGVKVISYGRKASDLKLLDMRPDNQGQILKLEMMGKMLELTLPVIGAFQAWNALCALGMVIGAGGDSERAVAGLSHITGVPGRLQLVGKARLGGAVFVDYAHKPDALENVLRALRPHVAAHHGARLGVVFGCGGNRDKTKRPIMGGIAQRLADWVIVTDDNPRHEEPATIRKEILAGCRAGPGLVEMADRAQAIADGIGRMGPHDVLIIAGKGHEHGQIVGDEIIPFDDADVARKVL